MENKFILSAESTVDLPFSYMQERNVPILFYSYVVEDVQYEDNMCRSEETKKEFYAMLEHGKLPKTSQINVFQYEEFFESLVEKGDVVHLAFGSGMSTSVENAFSAAEKVRKNHLERKLFVVDTTCSSSGYGLFVDDAADMRDRGCTAQELYDWAQRVRRTMHHQFFSTDLKFFRKSGRMSGAASTVASILNIRPIMRLDYEGKIKAYDKVRGTNAAIERTLRTMEEHALGGLDYAGKVFISNSDCEETARQTADAVKERFKYVKDIRINEIGMIIASHSGPGTVAVFFWGDDRWNDK